MYKLHKKHHNQKYAVNAKTRKLQFSMHPDLVTDKSDDSWNNALTGKEITVGPWYLMLVGSGSCEGYQNCWAPNTLSVREGSCSWAINTSKFCKKQWVWGRRFCVEMDWWPNFINFKVAEEQSMIVTKNESLKIKNVLREWEIQRQGRYYIWIMKTHDFLKY